MQKYKIALFFLMLSSWTAGLLYSGVTGTRLGVSLVAGVAYSWLAIYPPRRNLQHMLALLVPLLLILAVYLPSLDLWFAIDDPCHLNFIRQNGLWSSFYDPSRQLSWFNFTPLFATSFGVDYLIFGLNPAGFYLHQLVAFIAALAAVYIVLLRFLSPLAISILLSALCTSSTAATFITQLMTRHYVEGLLFAALAMLVFMRALEAHEHSRHKAWLWAVSGALLYLIACLYKELYTPLVGVILFLPLHTLKRRLVLAIPYAVVAAIYIAWRFYMQGPLTAYAPYGGKVSLDLMQYAATFLASYTQLMHWTALHSGLVLLGGILGVIVVLRAPLTYLPLALAIGGAVLLPIVPVMLSLVDRYVLLVSLLAYGFSVSGWYFALRRWPSALAFIGLGLILSGGYSAQAVLATLWETRAHSDAEGKFMLTNSTPNTCLLATATHCLWDYKYLNDPTVTPFFSPSACFAPPQAQFFSNQAGRISAVPEVESCGPVDTSLPLSVELTISRRLIHWQFGPWQEGRYVFMIEDVGAFDLPRIGQTGRFVLKADPPLHFRLWYQAPDGKRTYSDAFELDTTREQRIVWQR